MNILLLCISLCATITAQELEDYEETDVYVDNAKENYFRYVRAYEGDGTLGDTGTGDGIPKPGGFRIYETTRRKRDVEDVDKLAEDELGKPLEISELEPENATELSYDVNNDGVKNEVVVINDFIRFRREAEEVTEKTEKLEESKDLDADVDTARPKREHERSGKMLLSSSTQSMADGNREPRGATKEQWIKQPYPVQTTNPNRNYDDNVPSSSEVRPPRVHFVTQRRSESAPPLVYHSYDREGRNRDFNRDRDMEQGYYPRPPRHYNPQPPQQNYPYRQDSYYRDERDRRQEYDYPRYEDDRPVPSSYPKQRRIIYYATLPEVVRSPPSVDLRDRFNYRERDRGGYDNRYVTSSPVSVGTGSGDSYRYRGGGNPYGKSRYDEASKSAYPTKVSTDVTVREVKKNPERRIYSEADRRYAYKLPSYHHDDGGYDRN